MSTTRRESRAWKTKHGRILAAALDEFVASGFDGASMDRIAARADVSKVTIYNHFKNKDELYDEVLGVHLKAVEEVDLGLEAVEGEALESGLQRFCRCFLSVMLEPATIGLTRLVALESFRRNASSPGEPRATISRPPYAVDRLNSYLTRQAAAGRLVIPASTGTMLAARQLVGMLLENSFHPRFWGVESAERGDGGRWTGLIEASVRMFLGYYGSDEGRR